MRPNSIFQTKRVVYYYTKYINNLTKQFFDCSLYDVGGRAKRLIKKAIISAFAWLRLCFNKDDDDNDKLFRYFLSCIIFKRIVLPESNLIYQIIKVLHQGMVSVKRQEGTNTTTQVTYCSYLCRQSKEIVICIREYFINVVVSTNQKQTTIIMLNIVRLMT